MDLLTVAVVMHELGHVLGHGHDEDGVIADALAPGVRRTDSPHEQAALADQVFGQPDDDRNEAWLGAWLTEQVDLHRPWAKRRA